MNSGPDIRRIAGDIALALAFFTRLPLPVSVPHRQLADAIWAAPVAGAVTGLAGGLVFCLAGNLPAVATALLAVTAMIIITGALHEDGLADVADGFWGGHTVPRRLEIMKDSRIGAYGVLALVLSVGLRVTLIAAIAPGIWTFILIGMLSRVPFAPMMAHLPVARTTGLAAASGQAGTRAAWISTGLIALLALICLGVMPLIALLIAAAAVILIARQKIGGVTGDVYGATQQLSEIAILIALAGCLV